ncbi:MAG: hypothetical protein D6761_09055 [Candidatus Dadabacteria bacterium]|nr:MAG: hypothetical protein D6761_09055 [Candidatus Dadabacteria bacterium]
MPQAIPAAGELLANRSNPALPIIIADTVADACGHKNALLIIGENLRRAAVGSLVTFSGTDLSLTFSTSLVKGFA